jgi:RNA polymerase sigma-70 factor (ECF subfamily)
VDDRLAEVEVLYRRRLREFRRVAAAVCGDREAAPDVVQEAFVRAVRELGSFRGEGLLEAWLWRIVLNTARNHRRASVGAASLSAVEAGTLTNGAETSSSGRIRAAVAALPERQRVVLFLRYYADLDYRAIAETLEISSGTVGATLTAARSALEKQLSRVEAAR